MRVGLKVTKTGITIESGGASSNCSASTRSKSRQTRSPGPKAQQAGDKLYSCQCQKVRVRTATFFEATCSRCHAQFQPGNHVARAGGKGRTGERTPALRSHRPDLTVNDAATRASHRGLTTR